MTDLGHRLFMGVLLGTILGVCALGLRTTIQEESAVRYALTLTSPRADTLALTVRRCALFSDRRVFYAPETGGAVETLIPADGTATCRRLQ